MDKKKALIFILFLQFFLFIGCDSDSPAAPSNDDDQTSDNTTVYTLSPPSWIIGTWVDTGKTLSFVFTSDNVKFYSTLGNINFSNVINIEGCSGIEYINSESGYSFRYTIQDGTFQEYVFQKMNSTNMEYFIAMEGYSTSFVSLYKQ